MKLFLLVIGLIFISLVYALTALIVAFRRRSQMPDLEDVEV